MGTFTLTEVFKPISLMGLVGLTVGKSRLLSVEPPSWKTLLWCLGFIGGIAEWPSRSCDERRCKVLSRAFLNGDLLAVNIPDELGLLDAEQDVEIERIGDTLVVRLIGKETLADLGEILAMFSPTFVANMQEIYAETRCARGPTTN